MPDVMVIFICIKKSRKAEKTNGPKRNSVPPQQKKSNEYQQKSRGLSSAVQMNSGHGKS
jgi:hypothetical protein